MEDFKDTLESIILVFFHWFELHVFTSATTGVHLALLTSGYRAALLPDTQPWPGPLLPSVLLSGSLHSPRSLSGHLLAAPTVKTVRLLYT